MKKSTSITALCVTLAALTLFWFVGGRAAAIEAVYPVERGANWFARTIGARARALWSRQSYASENARLRREAEILRMVQTENDLLRAENARLRDAAGLAARTGGGWLAAPLLGRGGTTGDLGAFRVGKGALDGVRVGAPVAAPEGLVGKVVETTPHTALVRTIVDPALRVACEVETDDPALGAVRGVLLGGGGGALSPETEADFLYFANPLLVRHLKRDFVAPPRARIVTSGLGGVYPKGLVVGFLIDGTREDENKLERRGEVVPAVDFAALQNVFIRREN